MWMADHYGMPVRLLYEDVHKDAEAREIFHQHHVDLDKIEYMFKKIKKV